MFILYRVSHIEMRYYRLQKKIENEQFLYNNMILYSRKLMDFFYIWDIFNYKCTHMFKIYNSAHNIKIQKPNYSNRSTERVMHNERLFSVFVRKSTYNLNMSVFIVENVPNIKKSISFLEYKSILL